jgi:DNA-binding YbaB/EbfC family protein
VFPSGSEGFDVSALLQQAQRMQEQFASAQQNLADAEVTGTAGGGLVSATVAGTGELVSLVIDPSVVDPEYVETLADLIVAAVRDGNAQVQKLAADQMSGLTPDLSSALGALGGPALDSSTGDDASADADAPDTDTR